MITNMRAAISSSNVLLDLALIPGVILVPSKLIILDKPIPGYNNVLTIAKQTMQFGINQDINRQVVVPKPQLTSNALPQKSVPAGPKVTSRQDPPKLSVKVPHPRASHQDRVVWGQWV